MLTYFITIILSLTLTLSALDYQPIQDQATIPILTPDLAARKIAKLKLKNDLEVYLVSDPNTDQSGAMMIVKTGSWDDPKEYPGMAHFLEHMLFLGTEKYPKESSYQQFIAEHGGITNAFTGMKQTTYLFSVNNDAVEEALDRFSEFFKAPLFNPSGVSRELQAIDQEYATHLENDDMHALMVDKALANPNHPYHNFSIGNTKTLSPVSPEIMKKWYKDHYSANLMRLVVYTSVPMESLISFVVTHFQEIPNNNLTLPKYEAPLFLPTHRPEIVHIDAIKNSRTLSIIWDVPKPFSEMQDTRPSSIICHLLGHEGKNSLLYTLKQEKLADTIHCGSYQFSPDVQEIYVDIELTDQGLDHINGVITRVFQTLEKLQKTTFPKYLFDEIQKIDTLDYQYQQRADLFAQMMKYASYGAYEPLATYPEKSIIAEKYDPEAIQQLAKLLTPANARLRLIAPSSITKITPEQKEQWMGTGYSLKPVDKTTVEEWNHPDSNEGIQFPEPNPFLPNPKTDNTTISQDNDRLIPVPKVLLKNDSALIYYAKDSRYNIPQTSWIFEFRTPDFDPGSPVKIVLADLFVKAVKEKMNTIGYQAQLAGINYEIKRKDFGIALTIDGFSDKAPVLLKEILRCMTNCLPSETEFELYRQTLQREYQNFAKKSPLEQAGEYLRSVIYKKFSTEKQKAQAVNRITYEKFKNFTQELFAQLFVESVIYGDITEEQANEATQLVLNSFHSEPYPKGIERRPEVVMLTDQQGPFFWDINSKIIGNAVILAIEQPTFSFKDRAAQQVLMLAIESPFFATLRTKQQTGYAVLSDDREIEKQLFDIFAVQSNTHDVRDLLSRFELFIETFLQDLKHDYTAERFEGIRYSVLCALNQPPKNLKEMTEALFKFGFEYEGDFDWLDKRIKGVQELTYEEFLNKSLEVLGKENKRRIAILLKGQLQKDGFRYSPLGSIFRFRKNSSYTER